MSRWLWRLLVGDLHARKREAKRERGRRKLKQLHRRRRRERAARLEQYAIGWCHSMAIREDRVRTIRRELERAFQEHLARKVVRFTHPGLLG